MAAETLLRVDGLHKHFRGIHAVDGTSFDVQRGDIVGLVGPNGSGKTTIFNLITGFIPADRGRIELRGESIRGLRPHRIARRGLCRTFQGSRSPETMTVMENMLLARQQQTGESILAAALKPGRVRAEERQALARARELLAVVQLEAMADELVGSLSGGQKKLLSLAQVLMAGPELVLLDEPVAGVNRRLIDDIVAAILRLRSEGYATFLVIEHNMNVVRRLCDHVHVLDAGRVIAAGPPRETLRREEVLRAYLGGSHRDEPASAAEFGAGGEAS